MDGPGHYRESERLIAERLIAERQFAAAQVHATLALAAATAYPAYRDYYGDKGTAMPCMWAEVTAP